MNNKSVWDDISKYWKRIAAVIAAVGVISTFIINVFNAPTDKVLIITAGTGIILLLISFYVDKQTQYSREEITQAKKNNDENLANHIKDSNQIINGFTDTLSEIKKTGEDTRKDTLRIQLLMIMKDQPENTDTILRLAQTYFIKLKGDWYMTSEFNKWAKAHDIELPPDIFRAVNDINQNH